LPECDSTIGQPNLGYKLLEQAMSLEEKTHSNLLGKFEMLIMHVTSLLKGRKKSQVLRGTITNSDIKHGPDNTWSTKVFVNKMNTLGKVTTKQVPRQTQNQHLSPCALTSGQATSVLILQ
jgi:hypothetical protein